MKKILFDSLDEADAQKLNGCKVVDESGKSIGTVDGLWMDSTSRRVEFVGVKSDLSAGKVHLVPAGEAQIVEEEYSIKLPYPAELIAKVPSFSSRFWSIRGMMLTGRIWKRATRRFSTKTDLSPIPYPRWMLHGSFCVPKMKLKHGTGKTGSRTAPSIRKLNRDSVEGFRPFQHP